MPLITAEKANGLIEGLAEAFRGEVTLRMGPISPHPEMTFYHKRQLVYVDLTLRDGAERLTVTRSFKPDPKRRLFDLRLYRPHRFAPLLRLLRISDGREKVSEDFRSIRLWVDSVGRCASFFRPETCQRLKELSLLETEGELAVAWTPSRFLIQKPMTRFALGSLKTGVDVTLGLLESLERGGVLPFAPEETPEMGAGSVVWDPVVGACCVCGDDLARRVVYCGACSTPHHPECWEYVGRCSVYACGGQSNSPRMAR